ncbi:MAG: hypothetical protein ACEQSU_02985 [Microgenomates group bacterium]
MTIFAHDAKLENRVKLAVSRIAGVREIDGRLVVDIPVRYPSGSTVVVEIERNHDEFWVSDMGLAHLESEIMAAQGYFANSARKAADRYSVGFDGNAIFTLRVPNSRLEAAIICVANASQFACEEAIRNANEAQVFARSNKIFERVSKIFGPKLVSKSVEMRGRHTSWEAHNVVIFPDRKTAVFESMTNNSVSVSSKFLMFSDLRAASDDIALNVVVGSISSLEPKAQMIGDLANILSLTDVTDEEIRNYAIAG